MQKGSIWKASAGRATDIFMTHRFGFRKNKNSLATKLVKSKYSHTNSF